MSAPPGRAAPLVQGRSLEQLAEERDFLLRSISDLEREHAAGDVDDTDYAALRAGYVERAAATLRLIAEAEGATAPPTPAAGPAALPPTPPPSPAAAPTPAPDATRMHRLRRFLGRRGTRRVLVPIGLVCLLGLLSIVAVRAAGVRLPGESATGSITLSSAAEVRQELDQASVLAADGKLDRAINVYDAVLAQVPHQPEALAYKGWFLRLAGLDARSTVAVADGDATLGDAVRYAPGYALARVFDGIALLEDENDPKGALVQFRAFLADKPATSLLDSVGSEVAKAFTDRHVAVPDELRPFVPASK